ncbi:heme exporter protein CcmD [Elioraea tepidiphila]|jgi:heme exporter protein D|uniref:heme exporter protein CcmD n=1 Tax=Elioraea tepidiphila TaxID=457934 RepID=UPI00038036EB|nr:heme exporter protein CcmD [Elioraea tepidiphila]
MSEFLSMGGYAAFVWPSYAVAVGALVALAAVSFRQWRAAKAEVARLEALGPRRRGGGGA